MTWLVRTELLFVAAMVAVAGGRAQAAAGPTVNEQMARARVAEQQLDYDVAAELWLAVVSRQDLTGDQRFEANLSAGRVNRILGHDTEARMNFLYVLRQQPDYQLPPGAPPKVADFFELVRQEVVAAGTSNASRGRPPESSIPVSGSRPGPVPTSLPASVPAPVAARQPHWVLLIGGSAVAAAGIAALVGAGVAGAQVSAAERRALVTPEQVDRAAMYDERDSWAWVANIGLGSGALLAVGGATLVAVGLWWNGE